MPYTMRWLVDKRVIYTEFEGAITTDDLHNLINDMQAHLDEGIPLVHHISNSHGIEKVQFSIGALRTIASAVKMIGQLGWQIDINTNPMNKMFASIGSQFAGIRSRTFPDLDSAIAFLSENDATLANTTWDIPVTEDEPIQSEVNISS